MNTPIQLLYQLLIVIHVIVFSLDFSNERRSFLRFAAAIVLLFSVIRLLIESIQIVSDHVGYVTDWENWIEVGLFVASILFASGGFIQCCVCVKNWQWQLGAAAIFLAWFDLVLFMKKLPLFGVYVVMFIQIVYTFLRFMFLAFLFIVAFGLAFYMLFVQLNEPVSFFVVSQYVYTHKKQHFMEYLVLR